MLPLTFILLHFLNCGNIFLFSSLKHIINRTKKNSFISHHKTKSDLILFVTSKKLTKVNFNSFRISYMNIKNYTFCIEFSSRIPFKTGRESKRIGYIHYIDESHKMIKIRKCEKGHIASFMLGNKKIQLYALTFCLCTSFSVLFYK